MHIKRLVIATNNPGKLAEVRRLLAELPVELFSLNDFDHLTEVAETGSSFEENARLKAAGYALQTGLPSLADDSGLEVAALEGRPGIHSARYGGPDTGFDEKMAELLTELDDAGDHTRTARFICAIAISNAEGNVLFTTDGICQGRIAERPRGNQGFGYDPLFIPDRFEQTFGELADEVKGKISHRARAFEKIIPILRGLL
jgi:XTP/dITP diphosphohydrolase